MEGLLLTEEGMYVMEKLVGASDHDHLEGPVLFSFFVVILSESRICLSSNSTLYG